MNIRNKQALAVVLSIGGAVGTVATALLARKAGLMEKDIKRDLEPTDQPMNLKQQIVFWTPLYKTTVIVGAATVASIIGSTIMSRKAQASIMSMAVLADQGWKKYKDEVKKTLGFPTHDNILKNVAKSTAVPKDMFLSADKNSTMEIFFEEHIGYFKANRADVMKAYADINEMLNTQELLDDDEELDGINWKISIESFLHFAKGQPANKDLNYDVLKSWGWTREYMAQMAPSTWIYMHLLNEKTLDGEVPYSVVSWDVEPIIMDQYASYDRNPIDDLKDEAIDIGDTNEK